MGERNILEILKKRPVLGDGSYVVTLERRGYVTAGHWTPEAVLDHPEAVAQLHREFQRAGADVLQAFTFYSADGKLRSLGKTVTTEALNQKACDIVWDVVGPGSTLVCGSISPTPSFLNGEPDDVIRGEFKKQCDILVKNKADFLLAEFIGHIREAELAIEVMKTYNLPVACTLKIGPTGDWNDISVGDCAVRMARAGADIVGVNCNFDPNTSIKTLKLMKQRLDEEGMDVFLMAQPLGFHFPEMENDKDGYINHRSCPFSLEHRLISRWDAAKFAREAFELGVRYIGGCCGFEPYHIRQIAEELAAERGFLAPGVECCPPNCEGLKFSQFDSNVSRASNQYWMKLTEDLAKQREATLAPK
ncbi:betaine--homocysteine S-methyltransferase 1-like [Liolophura sinensis]|uniref:betaine--homocysteine S-methyltransferase 1-like n=1 Tax=Liolophura sinensis TaxID=3198878 RepID=UPI003158332D